MSVKPHLKGPFISCRIEIRLPDTEWSLDFANRESPFEYAQLPHYDEKKKQEAMRTRNYAVLDLIEAKKSFTTGEKNEAVLLSSAACSSSVLGFLEFLATPPPPQPRQTTSRSPPGRIRDCPMDSSSLHARTADASPSPQAPPHQPQTDSTVTAGPALGRSVERHHHHALFPTPRHLGPLRWWSWGEAPEAPKEKEKKKEEEEVRTLIVGGNDFTPGSSGGSGQRAVLSHQ
ncbi:hypothetical protein THAOC_33035 [Thalassiosira oceanica]|uniref:Uncharacterized protein n=1 Tax=Thalassiosira oceanica TaxID=159749 RepID=K0R813_THAOC|nr:hypothetical protein THAOC_33035 [Thalassiosira oceanica]|eukprot:EJK48189.1 hypothetical protein THAOC_33035 [Thalassiosira oceanica]